MGLSAGSLGIEISPSSFFTAVDSFAEGTGDGSVLIFGAVGDLLGPGSGVFSLVGSFDFILGGSSRFL